MKYKVDFEIELKRNPHKGIYIAVEGIDGAGKTVQAKALSNYFRKKGKKVIQTREPRKEGFIGELIRRVLTGEVKIPPKALQYLFTTDRVIHHEEVILPALREGKIVVSDRSLWSAIVYGILDRSKEYDYKTSDQLLIAQSIISMYHQFTVPDFTFYLNISLNEAMRRIEQKQKGEKKEIYEEREKVEEVRKGYEWLVKKFRGKIIKIDGQQSIEDVTKEMVGIITKAKKI
jgi:dTMP kinase